MSIELHGNWKKGFAYDKHLKQSVFMGQDQYGRNQFDNTRSEMGELVYRLKYQDDFSVIPTIVELISNQFLGLEKFDYIVPVPASKQRAQQPVYEIAKALAEKQSVGYLQALNKTSQEEAKNSADVEERVSNLLSSIKLNVESQQIFGKKILLVDDLYQTGLTMKVCTKILLESGCDMVSIIAMTKGRGS